MGILMDKSLDNQFNIITGPIIYGDGIVHRIKFSVSISFDGIFSDLYGKGFMSAIINPKVFCTPFGWEFDNLPNLFYIQCVGGGT